MMKSLFVRLTPILTMLLLSSCSDAQLLPSVDEAGPAEHFNVDPSVEEPQRPDVGGAKTIGNTAFEVNELDWDALIPDDFRPDKLMAEYQAEDLADDDPRAEELMAKLKDLWNQVPVRMDLDGETIKLPGFVVPVEGDAEETTGFLLVPYYGACIHVPPPPANQTVYVLTQAGKGTKPGLFDVVSVTGTMSVKRIDNDVAEAGYTLYATAIEPYE